ncbi:T9SS type A sorting domain-containing protein [candidate division WOR-3 bacterium]|nr:T9SS type A sorting domain-containing protein [candidate division WOR-3 bacterium]
MYRFVKVLGMAALLGVFFSQSAVADYYGMVGYDFGENADMVLQIKLADVDNDGCKEVVVLLSGGWEEAGEWYGEKLCILKWDMVDSCFNLLTEAYPEKLMGGWLLFSQGFDVGELNTTHPGEELVFAVGRYNETTEGDEFFTEIVGYNDLAGELAVLSETQVFVDMMIMPTTAPVAADVDGDDIDEIVVGGVEPDTINLNQTMENIMNEVSSPIVGPLAYAKLARVDDDGSVYHYNISDGLPYFVEEAMLDNDAYDDILISALDLNYTNANALIDDVLDFMEQFGFGGSKDASFFKSGYNTNSLFKLGRMLPQLKLKNLLSLLQKGESKESKGWPNKDVTIVRYGEELTTSVPQLTGSLFKSRLSSFENGTVALLDTRDGINTAIRATDLDGDLNGEISIKTVDLDPTALNNILTGLNLWKITEIRTSKWIDKWTGEVQWCDTSIHPEPRNIPHSLVGMPISGELSLLTNTGTEIWSGPFDPFSWNIFIDPPYIVTGENVSVNISNFNTLLTAIDGIYTDFLTYQPDSTPWFHPTIPTLLDPLTSGAIGLFTKTIHPVWSKVVGDILTGMIVAPAYNIIAVATIDFNYSDINAYIPNFNSSYTSWYNDWVDWAADSIPPYNTAYDSCLNIHNAWALEYYDSTQTGGNPPPEPPIDWPDFPWESEPEFGPPEYTGTVLDANFYIYDYNKNQLWGSSISAGLATAFGSGFTADLDGDGQPDFGFSRMEFTPPEKQFGGHTVLYLYTTTYIGIEEGEDSKAHILLARPIPNPSGGKALISYSVSGKSPVQVKLKIYDISGRAIKTLVNELKKPGSYTISWDGKDSKGNKVSTGIYFYRLEAGDYTSTRKLIILK